MKIWIVIPGLLATMLHPARAQNTLDLCGYEPVFMEDFNELSVAPAVLNGARWISHTPWNGDFGDAAFADDAPDGPFSTKNGILSITARKDKLGKWRSGLLAASDGTGAGFGVREGYFEARMRLPPGQGTWPAFWLSTQRPNSAKGPGVEIDVLEYYGHSTAAYAEAVHVWYPGADQAQSTHATHEVRVPNNSLTDDFHTYGVRVTPKYLMFYFDRKQVWQTATPRELDKPLYPLVNLALGSGFSIEKTPDPSVLLVDYIHVYAPGSTKTREDCQNAR